MTEEGVVEQIFVIKRLLPKSIIGHSNGLATSGRRIPNKSYEITNDSQRYHFVEKVLSKELTIREVLFGSTCRQLGPSI